MVKVESDVLLRYGYRAGYYGAFWLRSGVDAQGEEVSSMSFVFQGKEGEEIEEEIAMYSQEAAQDDQ